MSSDTSSDGVDVDVRTPSELLVFGLLLLGYTEKQINRRSKHKARLNATRFQASFGCNHYVAAQVWEDLQTTKADVAMPLAKRSLKNFFFALHFLKRYPTERERENTWHECDRNLRDSGWDFVRYIQALKDEKIVWPTEEELGDDIWIGTVDGTHIKTEEPRDLERPKNKKAFSYKNHAAGLSYELVLSLWNSKIIWMSGPYLASVHDTKILALGGLRDKMRSLNNRRLIADNGYKGHDDFISRPNSRDSKVVSKLKSRARARQEVLNAKIKTFRCVDSARFRHGQDKFKLCFEAAAVLTQYKMELGEPLFHV